MEGGSTMSTAYSTTDVVSTPLVLLDRELKKVTIGLAIRGEILQGTACARTSTFTWLKTNWKPSLFEYKSRSTYQSNNIDWALLNFDTFCVCLIKVEIISLHIKPICKLLERIRGSILYVQERNEH